MLSRKLVLTFTFMSMAILGLWGIDMYQEPGPLVWSEVAIDMADRVLSMVAMGIVAWTVYGLIDLRERQTAMGNNLARAAAQGDAWRAQRRHEIAALGQAIGDQFRHWRLSVAEIDVAGLMLKGASLKEIAIARDTSEATIRQQAQAIYRKSGLSGRAELSAYFLESLFETAEDGARQRPPLAVVPPRG